MSTDGQRTIEWRPFGWPWPRVLLAGLIVALLVIMVFVGSTSTAGFNPYNIEWDGTGEFRETADSSGELVVGTTTERYETVDPTTTTAVVLAPDEQYAETDSSRIQQFVDRGGTVIIADNYGPHGNQLLDDIGATARVDGRVLRDDRHNLGSSALPIATNMSTHQFVAGVDQLSLNYATAVTPGDTTPIANSSEFAYLDGNYSQSESQPTDPTRQQYPIVTVESLGDGTVVVIGDPSLFINSMLDEPDNRVFAETIVGHRTTTLFDQSHSSSIPATVSLLLALRSSPVLAAGSLVGIVGLILLIQSRHKTRLNNSVRKTLTAVRSRVDPTAVSADRSSPNNSPRADREALKAHLKKQHPEWNDDRIDRIIGGVLSQESDKQNNE